MSTQRGRRILFSLLPFLGLLLLFQSSLNQPKQSPKTSKTPKWHIHHHIKVAHSACEGTLYPELCVSTLSTIPDIATKTIPQIISVTVNHTVHEVHTSAYNCSGIRKKLSKYLDPLQKRALDDCLELFDETVSELKTALSDLSKTSTSKRYHDLQTLLSGAMTNQYTCLDGFAYSNGKVRKKIEKSLYDISHKVSNSLAMLKKLKIPKAKSSTAKRRSNREAFPGYGKMVDGFPRWVSKKDRRLLQSSTNTIDFDLLVAKDGTGNFTTISEAVAAAPNSTTTRFVIHIKAGAYFENVDVDKKKTMLMFIGDGIGKTVVKAGRNVVDGWTTFRSATVAVVGNGFIARNMTFENSAGPSKHQAVALRSGSDLSAFYHCSFVGYQDTLYVHSLRQFYRECDIYGTVDFIFGNAAVVLQNCNLFFFFFFF
ncbi:pectinesterase 2-like [Macadamia integrifolia]|uniref:pectinesterase 2-like n=1 Tax=Macadamia integrifolia TaxID=60698 RepID=UPI001C52E8CC|nr:pectinesterase 2-like [Macadamia integrifolia]